MIPKLRVARPTNNLAAVRHFYVDGLGLQELYAFTGHGGFDGLMLGHAQAPYHLEFTCQAGHTVPPAPTAENLLVFYLPECLEWEAAVARMRTHSYLPVPAHNAYWDQQGLTFEDPDGYRVVLHQVAWNF
ncbi:VOC family protein [Hymenobacter sp. UV11]|uniref:VOC family protein n=1 Tax=Hymenobacter sp. UV11 TaxID=1849735 RepID=UPI001060D1CA|nr:VOC family protein [Hymenobacter sp. UV11]TDN39914.1 glyoxalase [Hymenobacter sp. UV11]TFZ67517.1 VOC family protein [Hymenobacter sp. UV11]